MNYTNLNKYFIDAGDTIFGSRDGFFDGETWNSVVKINGHPFRERAELILLKDYRTDPSDDPDIRILIQRRKNGVKSHSFEAVVGYKLPGGGTDKNLTIVQTAIKECQEEARITPKNVRRFGTYDIFFTKDQLWPPKWIGFKHIQTQYKGFHTHVCVGMYDEPYTGHIDEVDKDNFYRKATWIPAVTAFKFFKPYHRDALQQYCDEYHIEF